SDASTSVCSSADRYSVDRGASSDSSFPTMRTFISRTSVMAPGQMRVSIVLGSPWVRPVEGRESYGAQSSCACIDFRLLFAYISRIMLPLTKRQREILDFLNDFIQQHGYAPSLEEIGRRFGLSSLATVHKHLTNLEEKGFIKRSWNRSRSWELVPTRLGSRALELPLLGYVAA